jgi:hypothetical protein
VRDPLYQDNRYTKGVANDPRAMAAVRRMHWLKLASGLIALGLIAAIWIVWRMSRSG